MMIMMNNNNNNNSNDDDDDDDDNFQICYPGWFRARRRHSQIRKEDHDASIFTCPVHTINVRLDIILAPPNHQMGTCDN